MFETFAAVTSEALTFTSGLYCACAGGEIAGTQVSYNSMGKTPSVSVTEGLLMFAEGTAYLYCATGLQGSLAPTTAVATLSPTADPGNASNPDVGANRRLLKDTFADYLLVGQCVLLDPSTYSRSLQPEPTVKCLRCISSLAGREDRLVCPWRKSRPQFFRDCREFLPCRS